MARRELGVFNSNEMCRNAKILVLKKIKEQFIDNFTILNNYASDLRDTNPSSNICVRGREVWLVSEEGLMKAPMVKRMPDRPTKKRRREPLEVKSKSQTKSSRNDMMIIS